MLKSFLYNDVLLKLIVEMRVFIDKTLKKLSQMLAYSLRNIFALILKISVNKVDFDNFFQHCYPSN